MRQNNKDCLAMTTKTRRLLTGLLAGGLLATGLALPAAAQEAKNLGTFNAWTAWTGTDANGLICYISAQPTSSEPAGANRDPIHFLVIHRKGLGTKNEVQTLIGYPFNPQGNASAAIDGANYPMVTEGAAAWLASAGDETGFVAALKKGTALVVKGTSQRGTQTTDNYSLSGVTAAMNEIDKACT
jgi:invasion protein IalB